MSEREREAGEREREEAEAERAEAEAERERREILRRIGEGGPEQHVPGNVQTGRIEAEAQRVVSEQGRLSARAFYAKMAALVALPVAFIALLPSLVGIYLVSNYAADNRQLIREAATERAKNRARFKRSDVLLCRGIEKLKAQNREDAQETFRNLDRTLRILRLSRTDEIEAVALENLQNDLRRNEARKDGCGKLPSVRG